MREKKVYFQAYMVWFLLVALLAGGVPPLFPQTRAFSGDAATYAIATQSADGRKARFARITSDFTALAGAYKKNTWKTLVSQADTDYQSVLGDFDVIRSELVSRGASQKILDRLDAQKTAYQNTAGKIVADAKAGKDVRTAVMAFIQKPAILNEVLNATPFRASPWSGKVRTVPESEFPGVQPATMETIKSALKSGAIRLEKTGGSVAESESAITDSATVQNETQLAASDPQIASIYTDPTEEIVFTQAIRDLAAQLNYDPLEILNYVAANIQYVPYYGSKKGADATLAEKTGNDLDQISLLAALLRVGDSNGNQKTQVKYRQANIKLGVGRVMDLLGVEDPFVAAGVLEKTGVPYILYVDQNQNPLFFMLEHFYAEAYVNYDYLKGTVRTTTGGQDRWVPMDPTLGKYYWSQPLDAIKGMNWNVSTFYDVYLNGTYGTSTPLEALRQNIQTYLSANEPTRTYDDVLAKQYRDVRPFEFIPATLSYELVSSFPEFSSVPQNLKHRIEFVVTNDTKSETFMTYAPNVASIADKELVLDYVAATPDDQAVIDSFPSIYDIVPLSLVHVKPVAKVRGTVVGGGGLPDPEVALGITQRLSMAFKVPTREIAGQITEKTIETIEKTLTAGGAEGIAINTDHVSLPETRPAADTSSSDFAASQKLYATALHFLYRLQASHDELAQVMGGAFTNSATRAMVSNGMDVVYSGGVPHSFTWKGLRIDASSRVNYWSRFGNQIDRHQKEFMHVFGLQASLDEARIFEDDYGVESMSTVKGLRMINQGAIPSVFVRKVTSANIATIDGLNISTTTKTKLKDAVRAGRIVYVPTAQFTYGNWTGLVYIDLDPQTGTGGYIIGEGLNGGYTAGTFLGDIARFLQEKLIDGITATIVQPTSGQQFVKGDKIHWKIQYNGMLRWIPTIPVSWIEEGDLNTTSYDVGTLRLTPGYGMGTSIGVTINAGTKLGSAPNDFDKSMILHAQTYAIPAPLLKSMLAQESTNKFKSDFYRYEPCVDYGSFSGATPTFDISNSHPFKRFAVGGETVIGTAVSTGIQLSTLPLRYLDVVVSHSLAPIKLNDANNDGGYTLDELWESNYRSQRWDKFCPFLSDNPNERHFTSQFVVAASYGLGQILYTTAVGITDRNSNLIFDRSTSASSSARSVYDLFQPDLSIQLAAAYLHEQYSAIPTFPEGCNAGQRWWQALRRYNGGPGVRDDNQNATKHANAVCSLYSSGTYNLVN